jgi:CDGSH iron-sulfur domain-containing protein 3
MSDTSGDMPAIGGHAPVTIEVEAGKTYWWCACGWFCACKRSAKKPMCDGSHKRL